MGARKGKVVRTRYERELERELGATRAILEETKRDLCARLRHAANEEQAKINRAVRNARDELMRSLAVFAEHGFVLGMKQPDRPED